MSYELKQYLQVAPAVTCIMCIAGRRSALEAELSSAAAYSTFSVHALVSHEAMAGAFHTPT